MPRRGDCRPLADRFWEKVAIIPFHECWEWTAFCNPLGYGMFRLDKAMRLSHRVAYALTNGDIKPGMLVCHKCDNPRCVRPEHLYLGTDADNSRDRMERGGVFYPEGEKNHRAKLNEDQVREIRNSSLSHKEAADKYGVSYYAIKELRCRKTWAHID